MLLPAVQFLLVRPQAGGAVHPASLAGAAPQHPQSSRRPQKQEPPAAVGGQREAGVVDGGHRSQVEEPPGAPQGQQGDTEEEDRGAGEGADQ